MPLRLPSRTCQPPRLQGPSSETAEVKAHCGLFPCSLWGGMHCSKTMTERTPPSPPPNAPPSRHPTRLPAQLLGQGAAMCSSLGVWEPGSCIPLFPRALVAGGEPIVRMRKPRPEDNVTASASPTARVWVPCSQPTVHFWTRGTSQDALCPTLVPAPRSLQARAARAPGPDCCDLSPQRDCP